MDKLLLYHLIEEEKEAEKGAVTSPVIGKAGTSGPVSWTLI